MSSHSRAYEERAYSSSRTRNKNEKGQTTSISNNMRNLTDILWSEWTQTQTHAPWHLGICKIMVYIGCYWCSVTLSCLTLCDHVDCSIPGFPVLCSVLDLLKIMSIESVMPSNPTMLSSVAPFSSYLQSFPASGSFLMSLFFISGGQSMGAGASASASVLPMNIQGWFPLGLTGWISLQSMGLIAKEDHHAFCMFTFQFQKCFFKGSEQSPSSKMWISIEFSYK